MSGEYDPQAARPASSGNLRLKLALGVVVAMAMLTGLAGASILWLDTASGHRALARKLSLSQVAPGITIEVGTISGSLWDNTILEDVALRDRDGIFLQAPRIEMTWQPELLVSGSLVIDEILVADTLVHRLPRIAADSSASTAAGWIDAVAIRRVALPRIVLPPGPDGTNRHASAEGSFVLAEGIKAARCEIEERNGADRPAGDRLDLLLRQSQDGAGLALTGTLVAERNGIFASLANVPVPIKFEFSAAPDWGPLASAAHAMGGEGEATSRRP